MTKLSLDILHLIYYRFVVKINRSGKCEPAMLSCITFFYLSLLISNLFCRLNLGVLSQNSTKIETFCKICVGGSDMLCMGVENLLLVEKDYRVRVYLLEI